MRSAGRERTSLRGAGRRYGPRPIRSVTGCGRRARSILCEEAAADDGRHLHVNSGSQHMSNAETRVSVILGVCRQDPERWREFDAIYRPILSTYLRNRGLRDSDASDVIQDVFVKLLGKIHTYDRARCKFRSWLFSVAHNTLIDHARRRASHQKALDGWVSHALQATPSDSLMMEQEWVKIHRQKILEHALKTVRACSSRKVWACFEQRMLRARPAEEIARDLKLDQPGTVYVNACRVLKEVRAVCAEFDEDVSHGFESDVSGRG
jgi:RNA polymerase sigma factor (sigma-70 family)